MSVTLLVILLLLAAVWIGVPAWRPILAVIIGVLIAWSLITYLSTHGTG